MIIHPSHNVMMFAVEHTVVGTVIAIFMFSVA
jgi:hypothetical protein